MLSIAKKAKATILSNDSFQEFHGEYEWLFDEGRLDRRQARAARRLGLRRRAARCAGRSAARPSGRPKPPSGRSAAADGGSAKTDQRADHQACGPARRASKEAAAPMPVPTHAATWQGDAAAVDGALRRAAPSAPPGDVVNELMPFLDFVQHHPVGTSVNAIVDSYSSHGAYVKIGDVLGYVPLRLMSDPPPRSAREVMKIGDAVTLVVASFAPARRSIDCAVPNMASVVEPQDGEAVVAEAAGAVAPSAKKAAARKTTAKKAAAAPAKKAAASPARSPPSRAPRRRLLSHRVKKAATASKAPASDVVEPAAREPAAKEPTARRPPPRNRRRGRLRPVPRAGARPCRADEVVSPEARARRRGPRTAGGAASGRRPSRTPPPEAADAVAAAVPTGDAPRLTTSQPRRRSRAAKKVADA